jgi:hypothetical protein
MRPSFSLINDINTAIAAHAEWKHWFYEHMAGILHLQEIEQTNGCPFSRWLEDTGKAQLTLADYATVHQLHAEFHRIAALLACQRRRGFQEKDLQTMEHGDEFLQASQQLIDALETIQEKQAKLLNLQSPIPNKPG